MRKYTCLKRIISSTLVLGCILSYNVAGAVSETLVDSTDVTIGNDVFTVETYDVDGVMVYSLAGQVPEGKQDLVAIAVESVANPDFNMQEAMEATVRAAPTTVTVNKQNTEFTGYNTGYAVNSSSASCYTNARYTPHEALKKGGYDSTYAYSAGSWIASGDAKKIELSHTTRFTVVAANASISLSTSGAGVTISESKTTPSVMQTTSKSNTSYLSWYPAECIITNTDLNSGRIVSCAHLDQAQITIGSTTYYPNSRVDFVSGFN